MRARPEWGALLIDLRQHGASRGLAPPHTVVAAARDLDALVEDTGALPAAVLGHSFGGKVALLFARDAAPAARQALTQVWVIDSTPAASEPGGSAWSMLGLLRTLPPAFQTRDSLIEALVSHGVARGVAQWLATNLEAHDDGVYRWRFDFDAMQSLLDSFYETAAWDVVESPAPGVEIHLVKAEDSTVLSGDALARAERAAAGSRTFLHRVGGGHWVNAENPAAIEELLVQMLPVA